MQTHIPALKSLYVPQIYGEATLDLANREEMDRESGQETYFLFPSFCPVHVCAMSLYNRSVIPSKMVNLRVFIALEETIITKQLRNEGKKPQKPNGQPIAGALTVSGACIELLCPQRLM